MSTPLISQTPLHLRGLRCLSFGCRDFLWITVIAGRSVGRKTACELVTRYLRGGRGLSVGGSAPDKSNAHAPLLTGCGPQVQTNFRLIEKKNLMNTYFSVTK